MRVTFTPPSENEFKQLFLSTPLKKGGGLEDISFFQPKGVPHKRGSGIFSVLSGVAKKILPFLMKAAKPAAQEFGSSVMKDILKKKKPLRKSLKKNGLKALKKTGLRIVRGSGKVRKKKFLKKRNKKSKRKKRGKSKSYKTCIFD